MTINLDVYCKNRPFIADLIKLYHVDAATPLEGYECYWLNLEHRGQRILIVLKKKKEIFCAGYDKDCIDESIERARGSGVEVPEELLQKFQRGTSGESDTICTLVSDKEGETGDDPLHAQSLRPSESVYTIKADRELYILATRFPRLESVDPWFNPAFGVARFSGGDPTYTVELEISVFDSKETLEQMSNLALYFAVEFDGIIYDPDNNRFGKLNPGNRHDQSCQFLAEVSADLKKKGFVFRQKSCPEQIRLRTRERQKSLKIAN